MGRAVKETQHLKAMSSLAGLSVTSNKVKNLMVALATL